MLLLLPVNLGELNPTPTLTPLYNLARLALTRLFSFVQVFDDLSY